MKKTLERKQQVRWGLLFRWAGVRNLVLAFLGAPGPFPPSHAGPIVYV